MYDLRAKQAAYAKNSTKRVHPKTTFFNEKTEKLIKEGYTRKNARALIRDSLDKTGQIGPGPFAGNNSRQTRKERSKQLKIAFTPRYNGPRYKVERTINEKGKVVESYIAI